MKMNLKLLIAVALVATLSGCSIGESNEETLTAFNQSKQIDCQTGSWETKHNIVTNENFTYNAELELFTNGKEAYAMNRCFCRK